MEKTELIERAKMYLKMLSDGIHPVTGKQIPEDSVFIDPKVKNCFDFIAKTLDEYIVLSEKVDKLEKSKEIIVLQKKQDFSITQEQCDEIKLSKEPITILSFMKSINSVIDVETTEKMTSTRINKWLIKRGFIDMSKVPTLVNKTVYKPTDLAIKMGIIEEEWVDKKSGEMKSQIKLGEGAQLFIIENMNEIIKTT